MPKTAQNTKHFLIYWMECLSNLTLKVFSDSLVTAVKGKLRNIFVMTYFALYWTNYKLSKSFIIFQIVSIRQNWGITTKFCLEIGFRPLSITLSSRILRIATFTLKRLDVNYTELNESLAAKKLQRRLNRRGLQITWIILKDSTITAKITHLF